MDFAETCPRCQGLGTVVESSHRRQDPACPVCKGVGEIPPEPCVGCGRAAVVETQGVLTCGREACVKVLFPQARRVGTHPRKIWQPFEHMHRGRMPSGVEYYSNLGDGDDDVLPHGYCC